MGKRSDFERIPRDLYPTPAKAVQPLIPYLRAAGIRNFAEPCCGNGDLVRLAPGDPAVIDELPHGRLYKDGSLLEAEQAKAVVERQPRKGFRRRAQ